jgi:tripartite-type tricarboxylate transporter receptor subunit TctC
VKLLVPYPPGQGADIFARVLAQRLTEKWGQTVYVENKGGGGGVPGMMAGKTAVPDGYTLVLGGSQSVTVNPNLYSKLPYDPVQDFQPVTGLYAAPLVIVVHPSSGIETLQQLVEAAKKNPGKLLYASAGTGTSQHLTAELFRKTANIDIVHVAYKGSGPAMIDLLGGQVKIMMDSVASSLPHIKSEKIRPLAVTTPERIPQLPDVPTVAELGFPGFSGIGWAGLFLQGEAPKEIAQKVSADIRELLEQPEIRSAILERGQVPDPSTPEKTAEFIRTDMAKWGEVAKSANIKLD